MNFFQRIKKKSTLYICAIGFVITFAMLGLYEAEPVLLTRVDLRIYDVLLRNAPEREPSPVPVIIDIDEKSLAEFGQWPWPRYLLADLLTELNKNGVASVGFDIIFSEKDNTSPSQLHDHLQKYKSVDIKFSDLPDDLYDNDQLFAQALQSSPAVLGFFANQLEQTEGMKLPATVTVIEREKKHGAGIPYSTYMPSTSNAAFPLPILYQNASVAFVNVDPDADGIIRRAALFLKVGDRVYPTLSLRALMEALGVKRITAHTDDKGFYGFTIGKLNISVDQDGGMYIPFIGPRGTYPYISASDVLNRKVTRAQIEGKIAFIGTSAGGLLDIRATPFDHVYPGVETHAALIDAILANKPMVAPKRIIVPGFWFNLQDTYLFASGVISTIAFGFASPRIYVPVAAALIGSAVMISKTFFDKGTFFSPLYVVMTVALLAVVLLVFRFWQEESQKRVLRNAFSRYVSPEVVKRISNLQGDLFSGEEKNLSILFTDIRGFTSISEKLSPNQTVDLLNRYFTPMTGIVRNSEGTLDKFIGDALMAFWNAPLDVSEHAVKAVSAAIDMQEKLAVLREELYKEFGINIYIGAGINTGSVYVGNMGSDDLVNYTLIGDNVNLASRLEGLSSQYGVGVVISEETKNACGEVYDYQYLDIIRAKGKTQPVRIFTPVKKEDAQNRQEELALWNRACAFYLDGDFKSAIEHLAILNRKMPDKKLYSIYLERAVQLEKEPPEEWDGIWTWLSK